MSRDMKNVEYSTNGSLNISDPVSVSIHFQNRFKCFFKTVILNKNGPLGEVNIGSNSSNKLIKKIKRVFL